MPMYALKSPDTFPAVFHQILEKGFRDCMLSENGKAEMKWPDERFDMPQLARREQNRFDAFRFMLRKHPFHRLHVAAMGCAIRCEVKEDVQARGWYLRITFNKREKGLKEVLNALAES
jgi:hypothetical protein